MEPFITSDGREVPLRAVGKRYVQMVMDKYEVPAVPTYEAKTVAGEVEIHPHVVKYDSEGNLVGTTLQTEEEWQMWREYQAARSKAISGRMENAIRFLMCQCIAEDPPPVEEWQVDFAAWGLEPPDTSDAQEYKIFWIENELLPDPDDLARLVSRLYVLGGIIEADQAVNLERFFRLTVERLTTG
jgi:uncharacterized protein YrzB (UPF0473 family)